MQDNYRVQSIIANYFDLFGVKDSEEVKTYLLSLADNNDHIIFLMNWIKGTMFIPTDHAKSMIVKFRQTDNNCLLYTSPSPRDATLSRMPSSA